MHLKEKVTTQLCDRLEKIPKKLECMPNMYKKIKLLYKTAYILSVQKSSILSNI